MLHKWCPDTLVCFLLLLIHSFLCSFLLGYIPKGHNHFGCRYAEACHYAITSFEDEYHKHEAKMSGIKGTSRTPLTSPQSLDTPLKPIAARPKPYLPAYTKQHSISPYYMPNGHPDKYFMSGYTGFIPKAQKYLGQSYPIVTGNALQDHFRECEKREASLQAPVVLDQPLLTPCPTSILYSSGSGFIPNYTGHIPGNKQTNHSLMISYSLSVLFCHCRSQV